MANEFKKKLGDTGEKIVKYASRGPKKLKNAYDNKIDETKTGIKHFKKRAINLKNDVKDKVDGVAQGVKDFKDDPKKALKNGAMFVGGKLGQKAINIINNSQKLKKIIESVQKTVKFITVFKWPIIIISGLIAFGVPIVITIISLAQNLTPSPHYYCDIDASGAVKNSTVYKQYCTQTNTDWGVENINGHYIIQDGSGPAASCAMANMLLRFYSIESNDLQFGYTNVYSYLWQSDGQYTSKGNSLGEGTTATKSIRNILNNYNSSTINNEENNSSMENGCREFASLHGKSGYTMSNWGYLRDESIDIKSYQQTSDFYEDQTSNNNWVWDLSFNNKAPGSVWSLDNWNISIKMNVINFNVEQMACPNGNEGYKILKNRIKSVLNPTYGSWYEYYKGSAGVMLQYTKSGGSNNIKHTILLTKYTKDSSGHITWYGVDSSLGTSGGWEGPLDGTGRFVVDDIAITKLLSSNSPSVTYGSYIYTLDKIGYCTKPKFGY